MDAPRGEEAFDGVSPAGPLESQARRVDDAALQRVLALADPPLAYWEAPDGTAIAAQGEGAVVAESSWSSLRERAGNVWRDLSYDGPESARPRMIGAMRFDREAQPGALWQGCPGLFFFLPRHQVCRTDEGTWYTATHQSGDLPGPPSEPQTLRQVGEARPIPPRGTWTKTVGKLRERIDAGEFEKVVLAHSLEVDLDEAGTPFAWVERLREANPGCYISVIRPTPEVMFVAATPERLVRRRGERIVSGALAGTTGRGPTSADDDRLSETLRSDRKEGHEHQLVVAAIRAALEEVGATVSVDDRRIRRLRSVQHLYTPVTATHSDPPHVLDLVDELHPTPAVGGWPRTPALAAIRESEPFDRGWYAGPVGWFDAAGDGAFAIGIRSAIVRDGTARLFAGAGIVEGSDPADEWDEVQWKYRPVLDALSET